MANSTDRFGWNEENKYWREHFSTRPYASSGGRDYDYFLPGYRYGYEAAGRYHDREWADVEPDLSRGWTSYEHRGNSTWEHVKDAVKDAWDRVTNRHPVGAR